MSFKKIAIGFREVDEGDTGLETEKKVLEALQTYASRMESRLRTLSAEAGELQDTKEALAHLGKTGLAGTVRYEISPGLLNEAEINPGAGDGGLEREHVQLWISDDILVDATVEESLALVEQRIGDAEADKKDMLSSYKNIRKKIVDSKVNIHNINMVHRGEKEDKR